MAKSPVTYSCGHAGQVTLAPCGDGLGHGSQVAPGLAQVQLVGQPVGCYIFSSYTRPIYRRLQPF